MPINTSVGKHLPITEKVLYLAAKDFIQPTFPYHNSQWQTLFL